MEAVAMREAGRAGDDMVWYAHHAVQCAPRTFADVSGALTSLSWADHGATLFGVWRSQIGRPRDELNAITVWNSAAEAAAAEPMMQSIPGVRAVSSQAMQATSRPASAVPPTRQGNYAFRWFELPERHWIEFLSLCEAAWPGFEAAYDSQVIGLWRCAASEPGTRRALLLTRRPDLAMWERSKIPVVEAEETVRRQLSRRYDLCDATWVYTTTLLTASDRADTARWT